MATVTFSSAGDTGQPPDGSEPEADESIPRAAEADASELQDKPVLEWTTEDWARWIEEPSHLPRQAPAPPAATNVDVGLQAAADAGPEPRAAAAAGVDVRAEPPPDIDTDADHGAGTGAGAATGPEPDIDVLVDVDEDAAADWSRSDDGTDRWWSSIAGLADLPDAPTVDNAPREEEVPYRLRIRLLRRSGHPSPHRWCRRPRWSRRRCPAPGRRRPRLARPREPPGHRGPLHRRPLRHRGARRR